MANIASRVPKCAYHRVFREIVRIVEHDVRLAPPYLYLLLPPGTGEPRRDMLQPREKFDEERARSEHLREPNFCLGEDAGVVERLLVLHMHTVHDGAYHFGKQPILIKIATRGDE